MERSGTALRSSMIVVVPMTAWLLLVSPEVLGLIFEGGRFSPEQTNAAAPLLRIMLLSVPFWALQQVTGRAFYARQDTLTPAVVGTLATLAALPAYLWLLPRPRRTGGSGRGRCCRLFRGIVCRGSGSRGVSALGIRRVRGRGSVGRTQFYIEPAGSAAGMGSGLCRGTGRGNAASAGPSVCAAGRKRIRLRAGVGADGTLFRSGISAYRIGPSAAPSA